MSKKNGPRGFWIVGLILLFVVVFLVFHLTDSDAFMGILRDLHN